MTGLVTVGHGAAAQEQLLAELHRGQVEALVAVLCGETVWWRCHRRLVTDMTLLARGAEVRHLLPTGPPRPHVPSPGARRTADGGLVWDLPRS